MMIPKPPRGIRMKLPKVRIPKHLNIGKVPPIYRDTDKDLTPDGIDCAPHNPRKQGPISWIKKKFQKSTTERAAAETEGDRFDLDKDGDVEATEAVSGGESDGKDEPVQRSPRFERIRAKRIEKRRVAKLTPLERVKERQQIQKIKTQMGQERMKLGHERIKLTAARQKAMPKMQTGFNITGGTPSGLSPSTPMPIGFGLKSDAPKKIARTRRKIAKAKSPKRRKKRKAKTYKLVPA